MASEVLATCTTVCVHECAHYEPIHVCVHMLLMGDSECSCRAGATGTAGTAMAVPVFEGGGNEKGRNCF